MEPGYYCHYQDMKAFTYFQLQYLIIDINESTLSLIIKKLLKKVGIEYLYELVQNTEEEILQMRNIKRTDIKRIKDYLDSYDLFLGMIMPAETISNLKLHKVWALQKKQIQIKEKLENEGRSFLTMPLNLIKFNGTQKVVPSKRWRSQNIDIWNEIKESNTLRTINNYAKKQLAFLKIEYFYQLIQISKTDLLKNNGIGKKFVKEMEELISQINRNLEEEAFFLGMKLSDELIQKIEKEIAENES